VSNDPVSNDPVSTDAEHRLPVQMNLANFAVLFLCTGNICRSPMGERLLAARIGAAPITVTSAGTHGLVGHPMDRPSALVLRELGGDPTGHSGRRLTPALIDAADLVLTAQGEHCSIVLREQPRALRKTFTMREFGRLGVGMERLEHPLDADRLRARVAQVAGRRGQLAPPAPGADEIGDPYGAPLPAVRACGAQIDAAVRAILAALGLDGGALPAPGDQNAPPSRS
jgi:protein-tyrosine phosphatase